MMTTVESPSGAAASHARLPEADQCLYESLRRPGIAAASHARLPEADRPRHIERLMPMARRVAGQYRGRRLEDDELEAVAYLALVEAADRFDAAEFPEESLARYAERCIRGRIRDALARSPVVRRSRDHERSAMRRGDAAPAWAPCGVAVEELGAMPADAGDAEALELALADCTAEERELVDLMVHGLTVAQAGRRLGIALRDARALLRGARRALESAFRRRGFDLPSFASASN